MTQFRIISDEHSNHGLPIGAKVTRLDTSDAPDWADDGVEWYTQGGEGDEVAIDSRDLLEVAAAEPTTDELLENLLVALDAAKNASPKATRQDLRTLSDEVRGCFNNLSVALAWGGNLPVYWHAAASTTILQVGVDKTIEHLRVEGGNEDSATMMLKAYEKVAGLLVS